MAGLLQDARGPAPLEDDLEQSGSGLTRRATAAYGWSVLNTGLSRLGTLAVGIVLARLLGPSEFGTFAVAVVALMAVLSFNELGVSLAIVRWPGDPREIAPTVNTISVAASVGLFGLLFATAGPVASGLGDSDAAPVIQLMSLSVVFSGAVATPAALLQRDFRQGRRMAIDQIVTWSGAGLALLLALTGSGAWSLAIGRVVSTGIGLVLFVAASSYPYRFGFDAGVARRLLRFGMPLAGASIVVFGVGYVEQISVGGVLGATALGYYVLAYNLASWPVSMISQPLRMVAPAAFARIQGDDAQMSAAFITVLRVLAVASLPVCLLLAAAAPEVVEVVYGDAWAPAAPVLRLLAVVAAFRILFELTYDFLVIRQRTGPLLTVQLVWLSALVPTLTLAASRYGLAAVAAAQLVVVGAVVAPCYARLLRSAGVPTGTVLRAVARPATVTSVAALLAALLIDTVESAAVGLAVAVGVGLAVLVLLLVPQRSLLVSLRSPGAP
jgi:O-antigen/teichoic acid export membrane protein